MDIDTPKGQENKLNYDKVVGFIDTYTPYTYCEFDQANPVSIDGVLIQNKVIIAIVEIRNKNVDYEEMMSFGSWLVTKSKLRAGIELSRLLQLPYIIFLGLNKDHCIMTCKITDKHGSLVISFNSATTETRKTINGGKAIRENAFIPMKHFKIIGHWRD